MQTLTTWVVKLSKFCNMRCRYCYEWNELGDRTRMSLDVWERVLEASIEHAAIFKARRQRSPIQRPHRNLIVFHGGEPLALPASYWKKIFEIFRRCTKGAADPFSLSVQSNLFSIQQEKIDLFREHNVQISVSYDLVPGVRLNVAGQPTEATVARNIDALRAQGVQLGAIAVLAKHTVGHVKHIHDFFAERGMGMRILPLFDGPAERDVTPFWTDHATIVRSLEVLFRHWIETGCRIPLYPLSAYFESALRHMAGLYRGVWDRARGGDAILLVNVDGGVYRVLDAYEAELSLGNLAERRIGEIVSSDEYARSLERDRQGFVRHCDKCEYLGACNGSYIYASRISEPFEGLCPSAHSCISFMIDYVKEQGYGPAEIRELLQKLRNRPAVAPV